MFNRADKNIRACREEDLKADDENGKQQGLNHEGAIAAEETQLPSLYG
jgi:hypothetical protein